MVVIYVNAKAHLAYTYTAYICPASRLSQRSLCTDEEETNAEGIGPGESAYLEIWFYPVNRYPMIIPTSRPLIAKRTPRPAAFDLVL